MVLWAAFAAAAFAFFSETRLAMRALHDPVTLMERREKRHTRIRLCFLSGVPNSGAWWYECDDDVGDVGE